ncbi:MAG TPA: D-glycero-beta-D-manno-heptose 1-phosphate adenylyltransferase [Firmicutes bacterium]|nr:D-glycero-beta-D-manno-heptose 1-phosphate adenylyltransferase [Bacillota bacterium]
MAELSPANRQLLDTWRRSRLKIAFTNGVFDLLHPGHIAQLSAARGFGDVLFVGLNSDRSVRTLGKGEDRPVQDEAARRELLLALRAVDAVELFDEPTPLELIRLVRPDVLVKGADYAEDQVVGADLVAGWGGRVELVPLVAGYSTSAIIERIRRAK